MTRKPALGFADIDYVLFWTSLYRLASVAIVMVTMPMRPTLPAWMAEAFQFYSYPLFLYSLAFLLFRKKLIPFLQARPAFLLIDLVVSVGVLFLGGSWRSSYFAYTVTTIMVFTTFEGKRGAYMSAGVLTLAGVLKDPSGGLPSYDIFFISDWDMRVGALFFYLGTGLIFGYFYTLLIRLETLSREKIEETRKLAAAEEKNRLALELHDGAKQMINAVLLKMIPLVRKLQQARDETADELRWLWRALHFMKVEMNHVMEALKQDRTSAAADGSLLTIVEDESRVSQNMTGFVWNVTSELPDRTVPLRTQLPLRRFLGEAMMNAWKHSGTAAGSINLRRSGAFTVITVSDKGMGFDLTDAERKNTTGLKSLRHRAGEMHGTVNIQSAPGSGCSLVLAFPANGEGV